MQTSFNISAPYSFSTGDIVDLKPLIFSEVTGVTYTSHGLGDL